MWLVIVNEPGFLPDCEPEAFETWQEAIEGLALELWQTDAHGLPSDSDTDKVRNLIAEAKAAKPETELTLVYQGYAHSIQTKKG